MASSLETATPADTASSSEKGAAGQVEQTKSNMLAHCRLSSLPAEQLWRNTAPAEVRSSWHSSPHSDAWRHLRKHLRGGKLPPALAGRQTKQCHPLEWGAGVNLDGWVRQRREVAELVSRGDAASVHGAIEAWVDTLEARAASPELGLECLGWAYALRELSGVADSEPWWRLVEQLVELAQQAAGACLGEDPAADAALTQQLLGGELPLVLQHALSDLKPVRDLRKPAHTLLTEGVLALTDGEGLPAARLFDRLPLLLACWTRCRAWAQADEKLCWSKDAEAQYEWLVRQALRLARPDGTLALAPRDYRGAMELLDAGLALAGDDSDAAAAYTRLGRKAGKRASDKAEAPEPSVNSEWSGISVLAADWKKKAQRAVVSYEGSESKLEYTSDGVAIFSGRWETTVSLNGKVLKPIDTWDEQCWYSDHECDYLELSLKLEQGVKLDRQIMIARDDKVAFVADIVMTGKQQASDIEVRMRLPLADAVRFEPCDETREGWLSVGEKQKLGVVPAALPEWRIDPRAGELEQDGGALVLRQRARGRNLCCPLFFDTSASRFAKQRTWRQLTVAEALDKVASDVAVAYRFQSGKQQWVSYRSLDAPRNRTFLGHNLSSEALFGRFLKTGEVDEFFEIEND